MWTRVYFSSDCLGLVPILLPSFVESVLKCVDRGCIDNALWKAVPAFYRPLGERFGSGCFVCPLSSHPLVVTSRVHRCNGSEKIVEVQTHQSVHNLVTLNHVPAFSSVFHRWHLKISQPFLVWFIIQIRGEFCCSSLYAFN